MNAAPATKNPETINWAMSVPFFATHLLALSAFWVGATPGLLLLCLGSYYLRMFAVTAGYHRYFAHRAFKTSRLFQFMLAFLAQSSAQKGALWWAAHHRHHHRHSDDGQDIHSPTLKGFWWSHVGWILSDRYNATAYDSIKDFARYPELVWLNRFHLVPVLVGGALLALVGGVPALVWGALVPTVLLWHGTFVINSLAHVLGRRRYKTTDTSRNSLLLALVTCGEGWHNNHHYHQNTANQGWFWWEVDLSFYVLKLLSWVGVVSALRLPDKATRDAHLKYSPAERAQLKAQSAWFGKAPRAPQSPGEVPRAVGATLPSLARQ